MKTRSRARRPLRSLGLLCAALASYQAWEEYGRIIGGRYLLAKRD